MILMEGLVLLPPERGTILGRALWKPRYAVLGTETMLRIEKDPQASDHHSGKGSSGRKGLKTASAKPSLIDVSQPGSEGGNENRLYISIYKAKGEWELLQQYPLSHFKSCEIRNVQYRKQYPLLPTLLLEMKPDPETEKQRKRRSSRTGGLSTKDPWSNIILFRSIPEERYNIYDWQIAVKPLLTPEDRQLSPMNPTFNAFTNPFASRDLRTSSSSTTRPDISRTASHAYSTNTYAQGQSSSSSQDRPSALISPSPSLRSRRSDLSSQASSQPPMGFSRPQNYTSVHPTDLPSPASTTGYDTQFIEGWTSAQGRSSALSTHTRGSNSIASAIAPLSPPLIASTSPGPRETILDRAFQMRCIPGSDKFDEKEEEKSSIARFEALMREMDEKKKNKAASNQYKASEPYKLEVDTDGEDIEEMDEDEDDEIDGLSMSDHDVSIPTPAQRALDYISGRRPDPRTNRALNPTFRSPPIPFLNNNDYTSNLSNSYNGLRPRAGTGSSRNNISRPSSFAFVNVPPRSKSTAAVPTLKDSSTHSTNSSTNTSTNTNNLLGGPESKEKRRSSTSVKRLSFQEFTKRLSSSSSLLLVQTNASGSSRGDGSGRVSLSSEFETGEAIVVGVGMRGGMTDKRCGQGWRGSVGVFGSGEGGFL